MSHLTAAEIARHLPADSLWHLDVRECVDSTNTRMKAMAEKLPSWAVLVAERQTAGRGRMTRSFFSPPHCGLYVSMLIRPALTAEDVLLFTPAAAVAAADAIEEVCGISVGIKWVNDLLLCGRKVGGILTESTLTGEGRPTAVIVGIGINVYPPKGGYPQDLTSIVTPLLTHRSGEDIRPRLCAALLCRCSEIFSRLPKTDFLEEYRRRSLVLGHELTLIPGGERVYAEAIDDRCRLVVRGEDGICRAVSTGEFSIRAVGGL